MSVSLNDLDAQLAALEGGASSSGSDSDSDVSDSGSVQSQSKNVSVAHVGNDAGSESDSDSADSDSDAASTASSSTSPPAKQRKKIKSQAESSQNAQENVLCQPVEGAVKKGTKYKSVCWKFLNNQCKFDDCLFTHRTFAQLREHDKQELVQMGKRSSDNPALVSVVRKLGIPLCKDFMKKGSCAKGKHCKFFHIESAADAKLMGFDFYCEPCRKGFTSKVQYEEHLEGKAHRERCAKLGVDASGISDSNANVKGGKSKGKGKGGKSGGKGKGKSKGGHSLKRASYEDSGGQAWKRQKY